MIKAMMKEREGEEEGEKDGESQNKGVLGAFDMTYSGGFEVTISSTFYINFPKVIPCPTHTLL